MDTVSLAGSAGRNGKGLKTQLRNALETARCRFAIAIAEETKSTPWDRRKGYLDTADRMRLLVGKLNRREADDRIQPEIWQTALEALEKIPLKKGVRSLNESLNEVVELLR